MTDPYERIEAVMGPIARGFAEIHAARVKAGVKDGEPLLGLFAKEDRR